MIRRRSSQVKSRDNRVQATKPNRQIAPWLLMTPGIVMILVALGYPLVRQFILSFQKFGLAQQFGQAPEWVGLENYQAILQDPYFWKVFLKSIVFCLVTAGATMVIGVGIAILLLRCYKPVRIFGTTSLVVVWAMPLIPALTVWEWLIDPNSGLVNYVLYLLGFSGAQGFNWLAYSYMTFYLIASAVIVWASIPLVTINVYAGLSQISPEILEAASIDGATWLQRIRHIMLPSIMPVIALVGVLQLIWDIKVFTQIYVLQQSGGIAEETNLLGTYVYQTGISQGNYGMASALAMVILLLILLMTSYYIRMLIKQGKAN